MSAAENQAAYVAGMEESENSRRLEIFIDDLAKTEVALADLPGDLKEAVAAILDNYGNLDYNALLKTVYNKYPAYAKKSRLRKGDNALYRLSRPRPVSRAICVIPFARAMSPIAAATSACSVCLRFCKLLEQYP